MLDFRLKTRERLNREQLITLENVIYKAQNFPERYMENVVWHFTWDPQDAAGYYGFHEEMSEEQTKAIRSEIIKHYRRKHPEWSYGKKYGKAPYSKNTSIIALRSVVGGDEIIVQKVVDHIQMYIQKLNCASVTTKQLKKTLKQLENTNKNSQFNGLKALGFLCREVEFLLPYVHEIGAVLEEMYSESIVNKYTS